MSLIDIPERKAAADVRAACAVVIARRKEMFRPSPVVAIPSEQAKIIRDRGRFFIWPMAKEIARQVGIDAALLKGNGRSADGGNSGMPIAQYRQLAIALALHLTGKSLPAVGHIYKCNHTTVLHAQRRMEPIIEAVGLTQDNSLREWVSACLPRLFAHIEQIRKLCRNNSNMWKSTNDGS